jgi:phosphate transport system protein
MRTTFQEELDLLEATLQEEGALVSRALRGALNALDHRDAELADEVIAFDDDVDARYVRIEEGIQSLLARQTPVASDLRLVLAILHVNLHLERMADYCVTIAKLSKLVPEVEFHTAWNLEAVIWWIGERRELLGRTRWETLSFKGGRWVEKKKEQQERK